MRQKCVLAAPVSIRRGFFMRQKYFEKIHGFVSIVVYHTPDDRYTERVRHTHAQTHTKGKAMKSETKKHEWSRVWILTVLRGKPVAFKLDDPKQRFDFDNDAQANSWLTDWRMSGMEVFDDRGRHTANV